MANDRGDFRDRLDGAGYVRGVREGDQSCVGLDGRCDIGGVEVAGGIAMNVGDAYVVLLFLRF